MSKSFFVSDIHFGLQTPEEERLKMRSFEKLADIVKGEGDSFYLVGDILDYWMEFRHVVPKYFDGFLCVLRDLVRHGTAVHYFAGNHDFELGSYFDKQIGIRTWYGMRETVIGGKKFCIAHGDGLDRNDIGYRMFVRFVRNRFNLSLLSAIQPDLVIAIMRRFSRLSRKHGNGDHRCESDVLFRYADALAREKDFDYFVCGHSHEEALKTLSNSRSRYINLGTWINGDYPFGVFEKGVLTLRRLS